MPRPSDDPAVTVAAQKLALSLHRPKAQVERRRLRGSPVRSTVRLAITFAIVGAVVVVGAVAVGSDGSSQELIATDGTTDTPKPADPHSSTNSCALETYVSPSDSGNRESVERAESAQEFVVASGRQALALETGDTARATDDAKVKATEVSEAVVAAGYPLSAIELKFAVSCLLDLTP